MKDIRAKNFLLPSLEYYRMHFRLLSVILPASLTKTEIEVMAIAHTLPSNLIDPYLINTVTRRMIMEKLSLSDASLSNHLSSLINKKYLLRDEATQQIVINPVAKPLPNQQGYLIKMSINAGPDNSNREIV